ncbi:MAG: Asp-tRNA(Asn)/Glu-tRNA(Gln) amidotransferase subunit GatB [Phycisphaerales bacterium]|nr:Asp-tRNA(Asn)/Glu-tRNA(Gln) amidotransferase subunit GatB [Phycisphaerales bacterium]
MPSSSPSTNAVDYKVLIGMEIHVQLATRTKMFSSVANGAHPDHSNAPPNTLVDPVILGLPGSLPIMNKRAVEMAMMVGMALGCEIPSFTKWDRKSYFYPDLPKNYQISQYDLPLCAQGAIEIPLADGKYKKVRIRRAHLEEDAGKLLHDGGESFSQVDLNRAGVPLLEVVTEPDLSSPEEARIFGEELRRICRYLGASQGIMQLGHMRFEPNINLHISANGQTWKTSISELKNLNSFRSVERACAYEIQRQLAEWHANGAANQPIPKKVAKFTRGWDDDKNVSVVQRSKEDAEDYRYFPDPDLVPVTVSDEWRNEVRKYVVELPIQRRQRYEKQLGLTAKESMVLVEERQNAELFEAALAADGGGNGGKNGGGASPRRLTNILLGIASKTANERGALLPDLGIPAATYAKLAKLADDGTISASAASSVFEALLADPAGDPKTIAQTKGLILVRDTATTEKWVDEALAANPNAVDSYKNNPKKKQASLGFLRGAVMKASGGKADPKLVGDLLEKKLNA